MKLCLFWLHNEHHHLVWRNICNSSNNIIGLVTNRSHLILQCPNIRRHHRVLYCIHIMAMEMENLMMYQWLLNKKNKVIRLYIISIWSFLISLSTCLLIFFCLVLLYFCIMTSTTASMFLPPHYFVIFFCNGYFVAKYN